MIFGKDLHIKFADMGRAVGVALHQVTGDAIGKTVDGSHVVNDPALLVVVAPDGVDRNRVAAHHIAHNVTRVDTLAEDIAAPFDRVVGPHLIRPAVVHHLHRHHERVGDQFFDLLDHVKIAHLEGGHQLDAGLLHRLPNRHTGIAGQGQWFFDQNVFTGVSGADAKFGVRVVMGTDVDHVDAGIGKDCLRVAGGVVAAKVLTKLLGAPAIDITKSDHLHAAHLLHHLGVNLAQAATTD